MATTYTKNTSGESARSMVAEAALTAYQFVKLGTSATQVNVAGAGEAVIGVVESGHSADERVKVIVAGQAMVKLGTGGATKGGRLKSAASGLAVAAAATDPSYARALETGVAGDVIPVLVTFDTNTTA